jgi:F-type H+-transporting ATPase subunit a
MATPVRVIFVPLNVIEELVKPVTLSLRLFGNIFAGVVMVFLLGQLFNAGSAFISPVIATPVGLFLLILWKAFDVFFVGTIQAFIFLLLTIIYFGQAREGLEEEGHHGSSGAHAAA